MNTPIYLIRHGHAAHNEAADLQGEIAYEDPQWKDSQLTAKGRQQISEIPAANVSLIYTSPLTRCLETARAFKATCGFTGKLVADDFLLETQGGSHYCNERRPKVEI